MELGSGSEQERRVGLSSKWYLQRIWGGAKRCVREVDVADRRMLRRMLYAARVFWTDVALAQPHSDLAQALEQSLPICHLPPASRLALRKISNSVKLDFDCLTGHYGTAFSKHDCLVASAVKLGCLVPSAHLCKYMSQISSLFGVTSSERTHTFVG